MAEKISSLLSSMWWACYSMMANLTGCIGMIFDNTGSYGIMSTAEQKVKAITANGVGAMQGLGVALALLFFIIALLELTTTERLTLEFFIKFFGKLVISVGLIGVCPRITAAISDFATAFTSLVVGSGLTSGTLQLTPETRWESTLKAFFVTSTEAVGWIVMIFEGVIMMLIFCIVFIVLFVISYIIALTRLIEMTVRGVFLPIAFALISDDGWRGAGGRYVKKYVAICCQGAILVMIAKVMTSILSAVMADGFDKMTKHSVTGGLLESMTDMGTPFGLLIFAVGICIAGVSVMFKSIGIVNDVFGA